VGLLQRCLSVSVWLDSADGFTGDAIDREARQAVIALGESCERREFHGQAFKVKQLSLRYPNNINERQRRGNPQKSISGQKSASLRNDVCFGLE
jgi:hypothetical protein